MNMTKRLTRNKLKSTIIIVLAGSIALSSTAFADNRYKHNNGHSKHKPYVYAKVIKVTPIYREIKVNNPVQECWSEPVRQHRIRRYSDDTPGNTLAGGLIGGIIGHQFGDGRGKDLATAVGTIIGAQAGHDAGRGHYDEPAYDRRATHYEERCETHNRISYEEVVDSYKVTYRYKGQRYQTHMPYDPGKKIKLKVSVEPVY